LVEFASCHPETIIGRLTTKSDFAVLPTQRDAWLAQITILRQSIAGLVGWVFLEFNIPRMGRRVDAVVIVGPVVFVVEFKVGEQAFERAAVEQVWDYALDLKNFHEASHILSLVPILIATEAQAPAPLQLESDEDRVFRPIRVAPEGLRAALDLALQTVAGASVNAGQWARSSYRPTPTIVEAARALYAQHSVEAIARYDAGAQNLSVTSRRIEELVDEARADHRKIICFVTGVLEPARRLLA
jgi:hypothetical protein